MYALRAALLPMRGLLFVVHAGECECECECGTMALPLSAILGFPAESLSRLLCRGTPTPLFRKSSYAGYISRGFGWRIHCGVEVTDSSTKKRHTLSTGMRRRCFGGRGRLKGRAMRRW